MDKKVEPEKKYRVIQGVTELLDDNETVIAACQYQTSVIMVTSRGKMFKAGGDGVVQHVNLLLEEPASG